MKSCLPEIRTAAVRSLLFLLATIALASCSSTGTIKSVADEPESAFLMAKRSYTKGDYLEAIDQFSIIKLKFSGSNVIDKSVYYLGMSYYKNEEYILAVYEFETILKSYATSPFVEDAYYYAAMCYYKLSPDYNLDQSYTKFAISAFQQYVDLFPNGKNTSASEMRMKELRNKLALKAFKNAEMYYNLENYRSAIVYYDYVLNDFFESEYADDALYGKIQALIRKKMYPEANKEIERFKKRFTASPLLRNVQALKSKIPA